jgi:hemerythrin superfamily protein
VGFSTKAPSTLPLLTRENLLGTFITQAGYSKTMEKNMNEKPANALTLLVADHKKVAGLFSKFEDTSAPAAQAKLVAQICDELTIHTMIEEEILYPALRGKVDDDFLDEAYVEHDGAKSLINQLLKADPSDDYYKAKVSVLSEEIEHHVEEEERPRDGLFAQAKRSDVDLDALGEQLAARKDELLAMAEAGTLPAPQPVTTDA